MSSHPTPQTRLQRVLSDLAAPVDNESVDCEPRRGVDVAHITLALLIIAILYLAAYGLVTLLEFPT